MYNVVQFNVSFVYYLQATLIVMDWLITTAIKSMKMSSFII